MNALSCITHLVWSVTQDVLTNTWMEVKGYLRLNLTFCTTMFFIQRVSLSHCDGLGVVPSDLYHTEVNCGFRISSALQPQSFHHFSFKTSCWYYALLPYVLIYSFLSSSYSHHSAAPPGFNKDRFCCLWRRAHIVFSGRCTQYCLANLSVLINWYVPVWLPFDALSSRKLLNKMFDVFSQCNKDS